MSAGASTRPYDDRGAGWILFAGLMMLLAAVLDVIYGIAAISESKFFQNNADYIASSLKTWGWITLVIGVVQLAAAVSIWRGGIFGQVFGIVAAGTSAIAALLAIPAYPLWSLAVFALDVLIIYGLATYGGARRVSP